MFWPIVSRNNLTTDQYGRNYAVKQVKTPYTLLMDDDWLLNNRTHLTAVYQLLEANHSIGLVAGMLCLKEPMDACYGYHGILYYIILLFFCSAVLANSAI